MNGLEKDIEAGLAEFEVPAVGCSVVRDGRVVFERGFGVRALGDAPNVDENTLFAIGSVSKSFTGTAMAMLVDEGKISWDSKVIDHLGSFRLFDPYVTRELTIRDLLVHRSGLERGDFMWYKSGYGVDEVLSRVRHLQPSWGFRTTFGYQNIMYATAGEVIRTVSGQSWDDFITERILKPLGMTRSRAHIQYVDRSDNLASSHAEIDGASSVIAAEEGTNSNAAGSIYSSARDMAQWLRLNIGDGSVDDRRLLTSGSLATVQTPQMLIAYVSPWTDFFPGATFMSYGVGWFIWSYRGKQIVSHGGNIDGMTAAACVVPEIGFGICVLANTNGSSLPQAIVYRALDDALGGTSRNWLSEFRQNEVVSKERAGFAKNERRRERIAGTAPSRPLEEYAGTYSDPFYGNATVKHENGVLSFDFIGWRGELKQFQFDSFELRPDNKILTNYDPIVRFALDDYGKPSEATMIVLGALRMNLRRVPDEPEAVSLSAEELNELTGVYVSAAPRARVRIELLDGALKATLPGSFAGAQSEYVVVPLVALAPNALAVKGTPLELRFDDGRGSVELRIPHQQSIRLGREE